MTIQVETKDCTALSDAELSEMADICADGPAGYDVGLLSKQRDEWVLNSQARESGKLLGFSFCTLEHEALKPDAVDSEIKKLFQPLDRNRGDSLVVFGWAMADDLAARVGK